MAKATAPNQTPATLNPMLAQMANAGGDTKSKETLPFMGFYSRKSNRAADVKADLPTVTEGQPFVFDGKKYCTVDSVSILGGDLRYFADIDSEGELKEVASSAGDNSRLKECVLTLTLVYTGDRLIPCITTFRTTKVRAVSDIVTFAEKKADDAWVTAKGGPLAKALLPLPARLRSCGVLSSMPKTSQNGDAYHVARAQGRLLNDREAEALSTALTKPEFNDLLNDLSLAFNKRRAMLLEKMA